MHIGNLFNLEIYDDVLIYYRYLFYIILRELHFPRPCFSSKLLC